MNQPATSQKPIPRRPARIASGMSPLAWLRLLRQHQWRMDRQGGRAAARIFFEGLLLRNMTAALDSLLYSRVVAATPLSRAPLFIIGHWRSGTTHAHNLLTLDPQHCFPNGFQCFRPRQFLVTERLFLERLRAGNAPRTRPMDDMAFDLANPQEDEFALVNMDLPSPYLTMLFPNELPCHPEYLTLQLDAAALEQWKQGFLTFLKRLQYHHGNDKRLVLKSPTHTARVRTLVEMFPQARFLFLVRDPYVVIHSSIRTATILAHVFGLEAPDETMVARETMKTLRTYRLLHEAFLRDQALLQENQLIQLRYEDLIANPLAALQQVYTILGLGDFECLRPALTHQLEQERNFQPRTQAPPSRLVALVNEHLGDLVERFGYPQRASEPGGPMA